ncbi:MAG TPA: NosD domain-containing protein [Natronosporangium sp.]
MSRSRLARPLARRDILQLAGVGAASAAGVAAVASPAWAAEPTTQGGPPFVRKDTLVFNVKDYGAVGDGTGDDTAALQAALDAGRGQTVFLPPGVYPISTMLTVYSGTTVLSTATTTVKRIDGDSCMLGNGVLGDFSATAYNGESHITIIGGIWDVNGVEVPARSNGFGFSHGEDIQVRDVQVRNVPGWHAMELNAVKNARVINCRFEGFSDPDDTRYYSEAVAMDYAGGTGHFPFFGAPDFYGSQDILVQGCYAGPWESLPSFPRLVGSHGGPDGHQHTGLRVVSNYADGCTEWAIRLYDWLDGVVEGNQIVGGGGGIQIGPAGVQSGGHIVVRGNTIRNLSGVKEADGRPPDAAICVGRLNNQRTSRVIISGNVITDVMMEGISTYRTDGVIVSDNAIAGCDGVGVRVTDSPRAVVSGNHVTGTGGEGIIVETGSNGSLVRGNLVQDSGTSGVAVTDNISDVVVRDNNVLGAGTVAGTEAGLRVSNHADRTSLVGNLVRRRGSGNEAAYGIAIAEDCHGTWYTGNDLRDAGPSGAVSDAGVDSTTDPGGLI